MSGFLEPRKRSIKGNVSISRASRMPRTYCAWLAFFALATFASAREYSTPDVCIIGAGPSGLTAAARLEELGFKVTVLEKETHVGGKAYDFVYGGKPHQMGAALVMDDYVNLMRLAKAYNAIRVPGWANNSDSSLRWTFDPLNAGTIPFSSLPTPPNLVASLYGFLSRQSYLYPELVYGKDGYRYLNAPELYAPALQYLAANNLTALAALFRATFTNYGYGTMDNIPAMYLQKYYSAGGFLRLSNANPPTLNVTFNNLFKLLAQDLEDVRLGAKVLRVTRSRSSSVIQYQQGPGGATTRLPCRRLILAFPQLLSNMQGWMDLDEEEKQVFAEVKQQYYFTTVLDLTGPLAAANRTKLPFAVLNSLLYNGSAAVVPPGIGEPVILYAQHYADPAPAGNTYVVYSYSRTPITTEQIRTRIKEVVSRVLRLQVDDSALVSPTYAWDYAPHFNTSSLQRGLHQRVEELQGKRKTYYLSGLFSQELVETTMSYALDLVDRFFVRAAKP
mmetsp:Transcript_35739/g.79529  ORF Transcript_35739/g.79529 Transcript_35739/m.79529 type:complete len:503 (-) Transcript_35739:573-2081(-)